MAADIGGAIMRLFVLAALAGGIVLQIFTVTECNFMGYSNANKQLGTSGIFLWQPAGSTECQKRIATEDIPTSISATEDFMSNSTGIENLYNSDQGDVYTKVSQASIIISIILAGFAMFFLFFECMFTNHCCCGVFRWLSLAGAKIFAGLTFIIYASDVCRLDGYDCTWSKGSTFNIIALALYILASIMVCCTPKGQPICGSSSE